MTLQFGRLDFSEFALSRATFEFRYDHAYLLWDKTGNIWDAMKRKWPQIKANKIEPNQQSFYWRPKGLMLQIELTRAFVITHNPGKSLEEFSQISADFESIIRNNLGLYEYSRLGFRPIFLRKYPNREAASEHFLSTIDFHVPPSTVFNIERGKPLEPEYSIRIEDDVTGVTVRLKVEGKKIDFEPPLDADELKEHHTESYSIALDIDFLRANPLV